MKKQILLLVSILTLTTQSFSQIENIKYFLALGVEAAEDITSAYTRPMEEGLMYGLTGGWYHSAKVKDKWKFSLSLVSNGTFVPNEKRSHTINVDNYDNLAINNGSGIIEIPTILGSTNSSIVLTLLHQTGDFDFEVPSGIGLLDLNMLPAPFLQASLGLPEGTELKVRFFPKVTIDQAKIGLFGLGVQHEFSRWFKGLKESNISLSALVAYTNLNGDYSLNNDGVVSGENHHLNYRLNSVLGELIASTNFPIYNVYAGVGYVTADTNTALKGSYDLNLPNRTLSFQDPFDMQNSISGIRASIGGTIRISWFMLNADYTFQGYNNLSIGLNFNIF